MRKVAVVVVFAVDGVLVIIVDSVVVVVPVILMH